MNVFQLIKASTPVTALLGTNPTRFFEFGTAPMLEQTPYATWQELYGSPFNLVEGGAPADMVKAQIDVWAETAQEVRQVTAAIRNAVDKAGTVTFYQNTWDEPSRLYRCTIHYNYKKDA